MAGIQVSKLCTQSAEQLNEEQNIKKKLANLEWRDAEEFKRSNGAEGQGRMVVVLD